jgi:uncharacterized protein (DUF1015 family)
MADILPIRAWRYNEQLAGKIEDLVSPLFDVVSEKQRKALYQNPLNSIHLSVPQSSAREAALLLDEWKRKGVLKQDRIPGIYVYYQYYRLPGMGRTFCRKGFICHIRVYDWEEQIILKHENTIPAAVNDRIELLRWTEFHSSPTHGLYRDEDRRLEKWMDEAIRAPLYETEDYQGVRDTVAVIHDAAIIQQFIRTLKEKTIIMADGHHRYEASLAVKREKRQASYRYTGKEGYNYHLMYLTNTVENDLSILPTHRLVKNLPGFSEQSILQKLEPYFFIKPVEEADMLPEIIAGKTHVFGLLFQENAYKISLIPEKINEIKWPFPDEIRQLDLTVMHYFVLEKALGIPGRNQRESPYIAFDRSFSDCLKKVIRQEAQMAIITNEVSIDQVMTVCHSGYTMPQKSTYFYPKVVSGFVFSSIRDDEFQIPPYFSL